MNSKELPGPKKTRAKKPPLTDAERHKSFVNMAREVGADDSPEAFDRAFSSVASPHKPVPERSGKSGG